MFAVVGWCERLACGLMWASNVCMLLQELRFYICKVFLRMCMSVPSSLQSLAALGVARAAPSTRFAVCVKQPAVRDQSDRVCNVIFVSSLCQGAS